MIKYLTLILFLTTEIIANSYSQEIENIYNQKIPVRDGIFLSSTITKPKIINEPLPALLVLSPYMADRNHEWAVFFAKHNYVVITVDARGRGNSEGNSDPFGLQDGKDGFDICSWIILQEWNNGKIGMYGGSYLGMVQWQILREMPPGLSTIVPTASVCPGIDFPKRNNIFYSYLAPYFSFINSKSLNNYSFSDIDFWKPLYLNLYAGNIPFSSIIKESGVQFDKFYEWIKHPDYDNYWKKFIPDAKEYNNYNIPILTITGYYDDDQYGAMHYYRNHLNSQNVNSSLNHYLLIGPWDHAGTRTPQNSIGDLSFGENSIIDMKNLHLQWFDWILKAKSKPAMLENKVVFFIMGENKWESVSKLDDLTHHYLEFQLTSHNGNASDIFHSGYLVNDLVNNPIPDTFYYNPLLINDFESFVINGHLQNYSLYGCNESYKQNSLIYHSEQVNDDIIIAGEIKLNLFLEMNVKDADFEILLYEIQENGKCVFLTTDIIRARYRNSIDKESFPKPNTIIEYIFNTPALIVRKLKKSSRLRLVIRNLNSPHYQKNFLTGSDVSFETAKIAQKGRFILYHQKNYESKLIIPIYKINH